MREMRGKTPCVTVNTQNSLIFQHFYDRPPQKSWLVQIIFNEEATVAGVSVGN